MKKVAILQSSYLPWKGYFDIINCVDEFIIFDEVQYTKRDWRNRNIIKTAQGKQWLTIPIRTKGKYLQKINEATVRDKEWAKQHWEIISFNYKNTLFFNKYKKIFENFFLRLEENNLSNINIMLIHIINNILGIKTKITNSKDYKTTGKKTIKLLNLCIKAQANVYVSGPSAKSYLDESLFNKNNIEVHWMNYDNYPEYKQLYPPFEHHVSIIDLLFNTGEKSKLYMKSFNL